MLSFSSSSTTVSLPLSLAPLVCTHHIDQDPDLTDNLNVYWETYIIKPQSGDIYVMATPFSLLQRFPFSMSELVDMSPFSFAAANDHRAFVGRKVTSLLVVELEAGNIKATIDSVDPWDPFEGLREGMMKLTWTSWRGANRQCRSPLHQQDWDRNTKDGMYIQSLPNSEIISFKARGEGEDHWILWGYKFKSPIIILSSSSSSSPGRGWPPSSLNSHIVMFWLWLWIFGLALASENLKPGQAKLLALAWLWLGLAWGHGFWQRRPGQSQLKPKPEKAKAKPKSHGFLARGQSQNITTHTHHPEGQAATTSGLGVCRTGGGDRSLLHTDRRCLVGMHLVEGRGLRIG
ncbi:hypothetical protein B0H14DRAFT_2633398 [Mycena olivaceomarginata]|nr:hypothetical protein B0H14DRAFT_2633398 [Mycena olivaceomarginata]